MRLPTFLGLFLVAVATHALACQNSTTVVVPAAGTDGGGVETPEGDGGPPTPGVALTPKEIATSKGFARCLAADAASVYACDNGNLVRYAIATGEAATVWKTTETMRGVEIIDGKVYATDGNSVALIAADAADGSTPKSLINVVKIKGNQYETTWRLGASGSSLFVYDDGSLVQFNRDGTGTPVRTKIADFFYLFPAESNFWLVSHFDDFTIRVVAATAPKATLATISMSDASSKHEHGETLAAAGGYVFSSEDSNGATSLIRYTNPTTAGTPQRKELGKVPGSVTAMKADETNLFVSTAGGLYRYTLEGTEEKELATAVMTGPLAITKDYVFFVDATSSSGYVLRAIPR